MKAKIYFCITTSNREIFLDPNLKLGFLDRYRNIEINNVYSISSTEDEIDFDDIGEAIFDYCRKFDIPYVKDFRTDLTAYIQVIPIIEVESDLRVYLDAGLLDILGKKGFGIDIHAQSPI